MRESTRSESKSGIEPPKWEADRGVLEVVWKKASKRESKKKQTTTQVNDKEKKKQQQQ